jgi:hypothetical protein
LEIAGKTSKLIWYEFMANFSSILNLLAIISLSLFSGAFLFIAIVMVEFWQAIEPAVFLDWMQANFFRFPLLMVPLNLISLLLTIAACGSAWKSRSPSKLPLILSALCILAGTITFPIYFAGANSEFLTRSIDLSEVSAAIDTWSNWHWLRTILAIAAVGFASWGLFPSSVDLSEIASVPDRSLL